MFSGIGGFEKGLEKYGQCIGFSEVDKYSISVYKKHFKDHINYGDATTIIPNEIEPFDLLVGGFPCQPFSVAGKNKGFDDIRGTLFFDIARILRDRRPANFLLENVKGLLSNDSGKTFQKILGVLTDLGYGVQWHVLNSKNFGVPQSRERVFIVGHLREKCSPKILSLSREKRTVSGNSSRPVAISKDETGARTLIKSDTFSTLTATYYKGVEGSGRPGVLESPVSDVVRINKNQNGQRVKNPNDPMFTLTGQDRHGVIETVINSDSQRKRVYSANGIGPCLDTAQGGGRQPKILEDSKIRRLTPLECERLQGFPDYWTLKGEDDQIISDTQRYRQLGNAVTVNVISALADEIFQLTKCQKLYHIQYH